MAIVAVFHGSDMTPAQYDEVAKQLAEEGFSEPDGRIEHLTGWTEHGYTVVDTWENTEKFERFSETLLAILERNGLDPNQPTIYDLRQLI